MATVITTPKPPLNIFDVVRVTATDVATEIYDVPTYVIPADGPVAEREVGAAAILTNAVIANLTAGAATAAIWVLDTESTQFYLAQSLTVEQDGYIKVDLDKQILQSGERLFVQMGAGGSAEVHLSFVLNQREEFTIIV